MNFIRQVYPQLKKPNESGLFDKFARHSWGNKAKHIQLNLKRGESLKQFDDPVVDIYPFIKLTLTDDNYSDIDDTLYQVGKNPTWQPTIADQHATDWYKVT